MEGGKYSFKKTCTNSCTGFNCKNTLLFPIFPYLFLSCCPITMPIYVITSLYTACCHIAIFDTKNISYI